MHSFVAPVLLGVPGLDALMANAKLNPPNGQARKPPSASTRARRPIVSAHSIRQAKLAEQRFEGWLHSSRLRGPQRLAPQDHPAECIGDGQRVAALVVTRLKVTLEVGTSNPIVRVRVAKGVRVRGVRRRA
jgi:hypothetical protein